MNTITKDHTHALDQIIENLNKGHIGKDCGHQMVRSHFEKYHYDMRDVDKHGNPRPVEAQLEKAFQFHPHFQKAKIALRNALEDTFEEKQKMLNDLDEAHRRNRERGGQEQPVGEFADATKRGTDSHGVPLAVTNGAIRKLNELADQTVAFAKRKGVTLTHARAFVAVTKTDEGRALLLADAALRGIR